MKILKNDFLKWHMSFIIPYLCTYIIGRLRGTFTIAYKVHPWFGIVTVILPLSVYLLSKNKKLIRQMIKSNFNMKCKPLMKVARVSTLVIMFYFMFSIVTGITMKYGLYGTIPIYKVISSIHRIATYLVPIAVLIHVGARITMKRQRKLRR